MARALAQFALFLDNIDMLEIAESVRQHAAGVEDLDLFRTACPVVELPGRISLDDQQSAALQRAAHAGPFPFALGRRTELGEDLYDDVECFLRVGPCVDIGFDEGDGD